MSHKGFRFLPRVFVRPFLYTLVYYFVLHLESCFLFAGVFVRPFSYIWLLWALFRLRVVLLVGLSFPAFPARVFVRPFLYFNLLLYTSFRIVLLAKGQASF